MRLMRACMTRGTAVVMCVTSPVSSERGFEPSPGGCIRQPDHHHKLNANATPADVPSAVNP